MKKFAAALLVLVLALSAAACAAESITVFNWYDYIDENVIRMFEDETGIDVKYANFTTNEEMYAKLSAGASEYDLIFPSDYIIERMIKEDSLAKLDMANIPNAAGVMEWLKSADYDPTGEYSVPYMWGTVGILYNTDLIDEDVTSWKTLFDPAHKKDVFMLDSIRDSLGITLKMLGYSMNTRDEGEMEEAKQALIQQKADGIVKGYLVDETKDKMISGEAGLALMWSGDALYSIAEAPELKYVVPVEGSNVWVDGICIPKTSQHKAAAEAFINFLCRPDIAQMNQEYICYYTPIQAVVDAMDEETRADDTLNPSEETIARCEFFHDISADMDLYDRMWMEVRG